jgi:hypothetical protein
MLCFDKNGIMSSRSKSLAGHFVLLAGFLCLCTSAGCHSRASLADKTSSAIENRSPTNTSPPEKSSSQIERHFKEFQQAKDMLAIFELGNNTNLSILYESYSFTHNSEKNHFCHLAVKQAEKIMQGSVSECRYAENIALLILGPGERVSFAVPKWEVKTLLNLTSDKPEIMTKIGFEVFEGEKRQKEIIWSDTIVYPKTL